MNKILIGLIFVFILVSISGCTSIDKKDFREGSNFCEGDFRGFNRNKTDFQIDEDTKNKVVSLFEVTQDLDKIKDFCDQNKVGCFYYCREINSEHEFCSNLNLRETREDRVRDLNER